MPVMVLNKLGNRASVHIMWFFCKGKKRVEEKIVLG